MWWYLVGEEGLPARVIYYKKSARLTQKDPPVRDALNKVVSKSMAAGALACVLRICEIKAKLETISGCGVYTGKWG